VKKPGWAGRESGTDHEKKPIWGKRPILPVRMALSARGRWKPAIKGFIPPAQAPRMRRPFRSGVAQ
jgi:hypothetical protein